LLLSPQQGLLNHRVPSLEVPERCADDRLLVRRTAVKLPSSPSQPIGALGAAALSLTGTMAKPLS